MKRTVTKVVGLVAVFSLAVLPAIAVEGPPFNDPDRNDTGWQPGEEGPPPWATGEDDGTTGPPFNDPERNPADSGWQRDVDSGPPPWANGDDDEDGNGPPFRDTTWQPGDGPPPWANGSDDGSGGPPFNDPERNLTGWRPGDPGPPPWASSRGNGGAVGDEEDDNGDDDEDDEDEEEDDEDED